jgi:hypothetical protein
MLGSFLFASLIPVLLASYHNYREGNGMKTGTSLHHPVCFHRGLSQLWEKRLTCLLMLYKGCKMNVTDQEHHETSR